MNVSLAEVEAAYRQGPSPNFSLHPLPLPAMLTQTWEGADHYQCIHKIQPWNIRLERGARGCL